MKVKERREACPVHAGEEATCRWEASGSALEVRIKLHNRRIISVRGSLRVSISCTGITVSRLVCSARRTFHNCPAGGARERKSGASLGQRS